MAYVSGFENDVFISYAHADNSEGWIDNFEKRLANRLRHFDRNAAVAIWRDDKLGGADVFTDKIYAHLKASAILISILSPNGLESEWCQQERRSFEQAAPSTGGFRMPGHKIRAIKVVKTPVKEDKSQSVFGTLGFEFFEASRSAGHFHEFHQTSPGFDEKLDEVAQEVWALLNAMRTRASSPPADLGVYVATTTSDLEGWRKTMVDQLTAWNCRVLPESPLPISAPHGVIREALGHCALSVHCVGPKPGFIPEDETLPVDLLQLDLAREKGVDRIVCQSSAVHKSMQEALQEPQPVRSEESLKPPTIDVMLQALEDRVKALRAAPSSPATLATVYVVCEPSEWNDAMTLKTCLEADGRYAAWLPLRDVDDERVRLRHHREDLKRSNAVLVYWGRASESWFRDQFRDLIGARTKRRKGLPALCLSSLPNREQYRRPDLPFEQVASLECSILRPLFRHLVPEDEK